MNTKRFSHIISLIFLISLTTSCERPIMPGISEEEMLQEELLGGWETSEVLTYISHAPIPIFDALTKKVQENLEDRTYPSYFYITNDSIFFIQINDENNYFVTSASSYTLEANPMRIILENKYMICDEYAPYYYVKSKGETICFYLTKSEALDMIEYDGSFDGFMDLVKTYVEDAQFEFNLKKINDLPIFQKIETGTYTRGDRFRNK